MRTHKKKMDNQGFSLLELLVVILIMGVMIGGASLTYQLVQRTNVTKASNLIDNSLTLAKSKAMTVSAYEWNVTITTDQVMVIKIVENDNTDSGMTYDYQTIETYDLPGNVEISLTDQSGDSYYISTQDEDFESVSMAFWGLSGQVKSVYYTKDGAVSSQMDFTKSSYVDIHCDYQDKNSNIRLYYETGKHTVN